MKVIAIFILVFISSYSNALDVNIGEVQLSARDVNYFLVSKGLNEDDVSNDDKLRQVLETLYITSKFAAAVSDPAVDDEYYHWLANYRKNKDLFSRYLDQEIERRLSEIDWDNLAKEYYLANPDQFTTPESIRVSHILIGTESRSQSEAVERASTVLAKIHAGESFESLVKTFSDDPSAKINGGDLGYFSSGQMVPTFEKAASALGPDNIYSDIVITRFGVHLIKYIDRTESSLASLEESIDQIRTQLVSRLESDLRSTIIAEERQRFRALTKGLDLKCFLFNGSQSGVQQTDSCN